MNVIQLINPNILGINFNELAKTLAQEFSPLKLEYLRSISTGNLKLEDGFIEYLVSKNMKAEHIGEGHYPVDIKKDNKGIDVLCVCMNRSCSNEKSIIQNFKGAGKNLDIHFENGDYKKALDLYKDEYYFKLTDAIKEKKLEEIYYCAFISTNTSIYMSVFKLDIEKIKTIDYTNATKTSINFNGFIDDKYGSTKLYKSKKRLELRFKKELLNNENTIKILTI